MAKLHYNVVMHGTSGKIGDLLIYRQRKGKTIIAKIPAKATQTPELLAVRERFIKGSAYATEAMQRPEDKARYQERASGDITAFNLALSDYCVSPVIHEINTSQYHGAMGSVVEIKASDNFMVKRVDVTITASNGQLLEQGHAVQTGEMLFVYGTTVPNGSLPGTTIKVEVSDYPGNITMQEVVMS